MRILIKLFIVFTLIIQGCVKDDAINECNDNSGSALECVTEEEITSAVTGFLEYEKGDQEIGIAKGIKINKEWEASLLVFGFDSLFTFGPKTFTSAGAQAETIGFIGVSKSITPGCFNLSSIKNSQDSIRARCSLDDGDVRIATYTLDQTAENKIEIIEFDSTTLQLKARFKATFITDDAQPPYIPEKVRFFNVDMETN